MNQCGGFAGVASIIDGIPGQYIEADAVNNSPFEVERYYRVVLNQLMIEGGYKYSSLKNIKDIEEYPSKDIELVVNWLKKNWTFHSSKQDWSTPATEDERLHTE